MSWDDPQTDQEKQYFAQRYDLVIKPLGAHNPGYWNVYTRDDRYLGQIHPEWEIKWVIPLMANLRTTGYCEGYDARGEEIRNKLGL